MFGDIIRWRDRVRGAGGDAFVWLVGLLLAAKVLLARQLMLGTSIGWGVFSDLAMVAAAVLLATALGGRFRRAVLAGVAAVISAALLVGAVYTAYFDQVPSLALLGVAGQAGEVSDSVAGLLSPIHVLFVIDLPLIFVWAFARPSVETRIERRLLGGAVVAWLLLFAFVASAARVPEPVDSLASSHRNGFFAFGVSSLVPRTTGASASVAQTGPYAVKRRIERLTGRPRRPERREGAPAFGIAKGKNLIVIQAEALQTGLVGARVEGQPVVPNLERLIEESRYFPNTYSQTGKGNTSDAEFVSNTSLYPSGNEPSALAYARKEIPSLPRLLAREGYTTFTFHTNDAHFWNRFQFYPALGFDRYYDADFFGREDVSGHGASDDVLFRKTASVLADTRAQGRPFYANVVMVTAHHPFNADWRGQLELPAEYAKTKTGRYLQCQQYADAALGRFLDELERSGLKDESVIVVFGDHFGLRFDAESRAEEELRSEIFGHRYNRADFFNVPLVVRVPGDGPRLDPVVLGQVDIVPTVADLLGVDTGDMPLFGRSAFTDTPTLLAKPGGGGVYVDQSVLYFGGLSAYDAELFSSTTQERLSGSEGDAARLADANELLSLSEAYAQSLPERAEATDEVGFIPTEKSRPRVRDRRE